jgi:hypothetical protein
LKLVVAVSPRSGTLRGDRPIMSDPDQSEFEKTAHAQADAGFFRELWGFLRQNKKWWLLPILIVMLLFGLLVLLSGTGFAPFIYTLF